MILDRVSFASEMAKLFSAQGREFRHETTDIYWEALQKMSLEQFQHAITRSIENDELFPKIPKLWAYARELKVKHQESVHFSFLHGECDLPFSVYVDQLSSGRYFDCTACKLYFDKSIRWNGKYLRDLMEEAIKHGMDIVRL